MSSLCYSVCYEIVLCYGHYKKSIGVCLGGSATLLALFRCGTPASADTLCTAIGGALQGLTLPGEAKSHSACPTCLAKGRCQCTECDGSGLENWWLWQPASDPGWGPRGN